MCVRRELIFDPLCRFGCRVIMTEHQPHAAEAKQRHCKTWCAAIGTAASVVVHMFPVKSPFNIRSSTVILRSYENTLCAKITITIYSAILLPELPSSAIWYPNSNNQRNQRFRSVVSVHMLNVNNTYYVNYVKKIYISMVLFKI